MASDKTDVRPRFARGWMDYNYGDLKKIVQHRETFSRHEKFVAKLQRDDLSPSQFFRAFVSLYLEDDVRIREILEHIKMLYGAQTKPIAKKVTKDLEEADKTKKSWGLDDDEVNDIFDKLERENPNI